MNRGTQQQDQSPTIAWIALTERCNLLCAHCPKRYLKSALYSHNREMDDELFRKIEQQLFPSLKWVQFGGNNLGEQLLYSKWDRVPEVIARYPDIAPSLITNGSVLDARRMKVLIEGNWKLAFSIEAGKAETYHKVRGKDLATLQKTIASASRYRRKISSRSQLHLNFAIFQENAPELIDLLRFAARTGIDQVTVSHFIPIVEAQRYQSLIYHRSLYNRIYQEAQETADKLNVNLGMAPPFSLGEIRPERRPRKENRSPRSMPKPCYHPWKSVSINPAGDVMPCCATSTYMGNMQKTDLQEIWNAWKYRSLRKRVNSMRPPSYCRNCVLRGARLDQVDSPSSDERVLISRIGGIGSPNPSQYVERVLEKKFFSEGAGKRLLSGMYEVYRKAR